MLILKPHSVACRCSRHACQSRKRLSKHPSNYVREPVCQRCGKGHYRPDKYRTSGREHKGKTCRCGGYSFPHHRGRGYCTHNPELTVDKMRERYEARHFA